MERIFTPNTISLLPPIKFVTPVFYLALVITSSISSHTISNHGIHGSIGVTNNRDLPSDMVSNPINDWVKDHVVEYVGNNNVQNEIPQKFDSPNDYVENNVDELYFVVVVDGFVIELLTRSV